uniref:Syntaxin-5 N-terminal Sly1p-binding domain-containing protein n=1 Tax=Glycine max TaxID=3847 RepID=A0A0R0G9Y0_SOYBN
MASSYRDRTSEFRLLLETLKKIGSPVQPENAPSTSHGESYSRSEFNRKASRIGLGIHETSQKIARLTQLARKSSMFNDPAVEIQELTVLIKNEITALNSALFDLQTVQNTDMADGGYSQDTIVHSTANIKAHENRKQIFSKNASRENPLQHQPKPTTEPPPWSNSSNASESLHQELALPSNGAPVGNQLRFV